MTSSAEGAVDPFPGPTGRLVAAHRSEILHVLGRHGVTNARLFGSVARGDDREGSDLDILVDFPAETSLFDVLRIQEKLEQLLGVSVDLVSSSGLKERLRSRVERDLVDL